MWSFFEILSSKLLVQNGLIVKLIQISFFFTCLVLPLSSLIFVWEEKPWGNIPFESIGPSKDSALSVPALLHEALRKKELRKSIIESLLQRSSVKKVAFRTKQRLLYSLSAIDHELVRSGEDGHVFLKSQFAWRNCGDEAAVFLGIESALFLKDWAEVLDLDFKVVVPPNKASLYTEELSPFGAENVACYKKIGELLRNTVASVAPEKIVFYQSLLEELKEKGVPVFAKLDSHWTSFAGYFSLLDLIEKAPAISSLGPSELKDMHKDAAWDTDLGTSVLMLATKIVDIKPKDNLLEQLENTRYSKVKTLVMHDSFYALITPLLEKVFAGGRLIHYSYLFDLEESFSAYDSFLFSIVERNFPAILHTEVVREGRFFRFLRKTAREASKNCRYTETLSMGARSEDILPYQLSVDSEGFFVNRVPLSGVILDRGDLEKFQCLRFEVEVNQPSSLEFHYKPIVANTYFPDPKFRIKQLGLALKRGRNKIGIVLPRVEEIKLEVAGNARFKFSDIELGF